MGIVNLNWIFKNINDDKNMNYSQRLPILLMFVLLLSSPVQNAAETKTTIATEAGKAEHAFKQANLCEGMAEGDYLGADVCADCHQDKIDGAGIHCSIHPVKGKRYDRESIAVQCGRKVIRRRGPDGQGGSLPAVAEDADPNLFFSSAMAGWTMTPLYSWRPS